MRGDSETTQFKLHCEDGEIEATERTRTARGHEVNSVREVDVLAFGSWAVCRG